MIETKEMVVTDIELRTLLLQKREGRHLGRAEQRALKRKTFAQDQGECRDGGSPQENTKQTLQLGVRLRNERIPKQFSQTSSRTSVQFLRTKKTLTNLREPIGQSCGKK